MGKYITNNNYIQGVDNFKKGNYKIAKHFFELALNDPTCQQAALYNILKILFKTGNYRDARIILNGYQDNLTADLRYSYGLLESIENNFKASIKYYGDTLMDAYNQNRVLLSLAKLKVQMGDYDIARKMYETLTFNDKFEQQALFGLVCLNILEKDYLEALKNLKKVNYQSLSPVQKTNFDHMTIYVNYFLNKLDPSAIKNHLKEQYMIERLFNKDDDSLLLSHVKRHIKADYNRTTALFFPDIDFTNLLFIVRKEIEKMNANHFELTDMYRFRLDNFIGNIGYRKTSDICVTTIIGTKDIITMYPISLSDEFDKEGFLYSKELTKKRESRGSNI